MDAMENKTERKLQAATSSKVSSYSKHQPKKRRTERKDSSDCKCKVVIFLRGDDYFCLDSTSSCMEHPGHPFQEPKATAKTKSGISEDNEFLIGKLHDAGVPPFTFLKVLESLDDSVGEFSSNVTYNLTASIEKLKT